MPITGYQIWIRQSDLVYILDSTICDGLNLSVVSNTQCWVYLDNLITEPYNLLLGNEIYIKVLAMNAYGDSTMSLAGNGATM